MFNLSSLKAVILGLSFRDMREFTRGIADDVGDTTDGSQMKAMHAITDWAEGYESDEDAGLEQLKGETVPVVAPQPEAPPPEPVKEVHLDIPPDTDYMIFTAKVPNDRAEDFQRVMPDWPNVQYACEFVDKREAMNDKYWSIYGRNIWEAFFT